MIRTILVAGVEKSEDNLLVKYCLDNFLIPTHYPELSTKTIPLLDAAIIAASAVSHQLNWSVKDLYKENNRPIFYSNHGISSMKEQFENEVYGKGVTSILRNHDVNFSAKVNFILGRFFDIGDEFDRKTFEPKIGKIFNFKDLAELKLKMNYFTNNAKTRGTMEAGKRHGTYRFLGLTSRNYEDMLCAGLFLEKDKLFGNKGKTQLLTPSQTVPAQIETVSPPPLVLEKALPPEPEKKPANIPAQVKTSTAVTLPDDDHTTALMMMLEMQEKNHRQIIEVQQNQIQQLTSLVSSLEKRLSDTMLTMVTRVEDTLKIHDGLFELTPELQGMKPEQLLMFNRLFKMFKAGLMPER